MLHQWQCGKKHCTHLPARHSSNMQRQQQRLCKCNCNRSDQQKPTFSPLVLAQCRLSSVSVTSWNARFQSFLTHAFNRHTLSWQSAANVAAASADASAAAAAAATEIVFVVICTRGPGNSQPIVSSRSLVLAIPTLFSAGPFLMAHHRQPSRAVIFGTLTAVVMAVIRMWGYRLSVPLFPKSGSIIRSSNSDMYLACTRHAWLLLLTSIDTPDIRAWD